MITAGPPGRVMPPACGTSAGERGGANATTRARREGVRRALVVESGGSGYSPVSGSGRPG
jgi:hypothetical protein